MNAREWLAVDESAKSLLARTLSRRVPPFTSLPPLHRFPLHAGHVLEIVGPSGSGKSELLLQAAVACILPKQSDGISYGGSEGVVMMFDLDCRFDMLRFISALQQRINEARGPGGGRTALSLQVVFEAIVQELNHILESHPLLILTTKSLIQSADATDRKYADGDVEQKLERGLEGRAVPRDFMPAVWQGFVTHRLLLQGPFQPGSNNSSEDWPFFTAEWQTPFLNQIDKFIIQDRGILLKS